MKKTVSIQNAINLKFFFWQKIINAELSELKFWRNSSLIEILCHLKTKTNQILKIKVFQHPKFELSLF